MFSINMMKIETQGISFKARNPVVMKADRICRMVNTEFPSVSSSSIIPRCTKTIQDKARRFGERPPQIENGDLPDSRYNKLYYLFMRTDEKLRKFVREPFLETVGTVAENKVLTETVKKHHFANCAELTRLANLICAVNGIKAQPIEMVTCDSDDKILSFIDHVALAIPLRKNALNWSKMSKLKDVIIIDPWLGIADFAQNAAMQYQNLFRKYLKLGIFNYVGVNPMALVRPIPEEDYGALRKEFPNLVLKNRA